MRLLEDLRTIRSKDPAARNVVEILLCYPGLHAQWFHRIAHRLWIWRVPVLPRFISHVARFLTGVEIHPGATLGRRVFIDHGMGVVIGETAEVGDDCLIYQGVTLGGTSLNAGKRHPTLEAHVVVGSGAKVLGAITLGHHTRVGSGSVVIHPTPPRSTVVGIPGRVLAEKDDPAHELEHNRMPDPTAQAIVALHEQVRELSREVADMRHRPVVVTLPDGLTALEADEALAAVRSSLRPAGAQAFAFDSGAGI